MIQSVSDIIAKTSKLLEDAAEPRNVSRDEPVKSSKRGKASKSAKVIRKDAIYAPIHFNTKMVAPCLKQRREDLNRCLEVYDKKLYKVQLINEQLLSRAEAHKSNELEAKNIAQQLAKQVQSLENKLGQKSKQIGMISASYVKL